MNDVTTIKSIRYFGEERLPIGIILMQIALLEVPFFEQVFATTAPPISPGLSPT